MRDPPSRNRDTDAALAYHEATKHSERSIRSSAHFLDWSNQPLPFKILPELEPIPLPAFPDGDVPALVAIAEHAPRRSEPLDLAALARVLYLAAGITKRKRHPGGEILRRAYPNTGALGGRLYLAAYALGIGATGLTFFDDEVTDFFSPLAVGKSVMFLTALGHPDGVALGLAR